MSYSVSNQKNKLFFPPVFSIKFIYLNILFNNLFIISFNILFILFNIFSINIFKKFNLINFNNGNKNII